MVTGSLSYAAIETTLVSGQQPSSSGCLADGAGSMKRPIRLARDKGQHRVLQGEGYLCVVQASVSLSYSVTYMLHIFVFYHGTHNSMMEFQRHFFILGKEHHTCDYVMVD